METELLRIFDEEKNPIGVATRAEVHKNGFWHEVFQCWFVTFDEDEVYIFLQLRSMQKKDYPNLFDITSAGHLLADETVEHGVREIKEELGIDVEFDELISLGVIEYSVKENNFIDNEIANVFLYITNKDVFDKFMLQEEEVAGIVKARLTDFVELWLGEKETIPINGFIVTKQGSKNEINEIVGRERFVPHEISFYLSVLQNIKEKLKK
ncbi:NUDIX hydrolase [Fredinandcohnia humi]